MPKEFVYAIYFALVLNLWASSAHAQADSPLENRLDEVEVLLDDGNYNEAKRKLREIKPVNLGITQQERLSWLRARTFRGQFLIDSAIFYFNRAIELNEGSPNIRKLNYLIDVAELHRYNSSYSKALEELFQALELSTRLDLTERIPGIKIEIGNLHMLQGDFNEAKDYYRQAEQYYKESNDFEGVARAYELIGDLERKHNKHDQAKVHYQKALENYQKFDSRQGSARIHNKIGLSLFESGKARLALPYLDKSLQMRLSDNNLLELPESYVALSKATLAIKRYDDALDYSRKGVAVTRKTDSEIQLVELYLQLYKIYKDLNYVDSALFYHERYESLKDSVNQKEYRELIVKIRTAYETERMENELAELRRENQRKEERLIDLERIQKQDFYLKILLSILVVFAFVTAVLQYSRYRIKTKANISIKRKMRENELLLKELHHRVKNNLQFISSLFSLQLAKLNDPNTKRLMNESLQKVKAMAMLHDRLRLTGKKDSSLDLKGFVTELTNSLSLSYGIDPDQIKLYYKWKSENFDVDSYNSIGLIINEMITNSFKHCDQDNLSIKLGFYENAQFKMIRYADNGPGLDKNILDNTEQMGVTIMSLLVEDLGGSIHYASPKSGEKGIRIHIDLEK